MITIFDNYIPEEIINTNKIFDVFVGKLPSSDDYDKWLKTPEVIIGVEEYKKFMRELLRNRSVKFECNCRGKDEADWHRGVVHRKSETIDHQMIGGVVDEVEFYTFGQVGISFKHDHSFYQVDKNNIYLIDGEGFPEKFKKRMEAQLHKRRFDL